MLMTLTVTMTTSGTYQMKTTPTLIKTTMVCSMGMSKHRHVGKTLTVTTTGSPITLTLTTWTKRSVRYKPL